MSAKKDQNRRVTAVQELRRSNAAQPHNGRRPRGAERRDAIAANYRGE